MTSDKNHPDNDIHKGAVEDDQPRQEHNTSLRGQLGHRNQDEMLKDNDTDYPEPGESPEHTGQHGKLPPVQKTDQKDPNDPLAA